MPSSVPSFYYPSFRLVLENASTEKKVVALWIISLLGFLVTISISIPYYLKLWRLPRTTRIDLFIRMTMMPTLFAFSAICSCVFLRCEIIFSCIQKYAEALALHSLIVVSCLFYMLPD